MAITIDKSKLRRKLGGKYGGYTKPGDHMRFFWEIDGFECGGAKISHGSKHPDLADFEASDVARSLGVTREELKVMETCSFPKGLLLQRLRVINGLSGTR